MKVKLDFDESMRMFLMKDDDKYATEVEVPEELVTRFKRISEEFRAVDDELYEIYLKQRKQ